MGDSLVHGPNASLILESVWHSAAAAAKLDVMFNRNAGTIWMPTVGRPKEYEASGLKKINFRVPILIDFGDCTWTVFEDGLGNVKPQGWRKSTSEFRP